MIPEWQHESEIACIGGVGLAQKLQSRVEMWLSEADQLWAGRSAEVSTRKS
jgi:hypothetical protein